METVAEIQDEVKKSSTVEPQWLTIPGAVRYSSLSRSKIYELIASDVRSICLRDKDAIKGKRLVNRESLENYLARHENLKSEPVPGAKGRKKKVEGGL
jgi:hypothetical protein